MRLSGVSIMSVPEGSKSKGDSPMRRIRIEKVVLNIGLGSPEDVDKAYTLLERISGRKPVKTIATRKARTFKVRRGLNIGAKVTIRDKEEAYALLNRLFKAKGNKIKKSNFDDNGNFGSGLEEYLEIPGMKYDPKIGVMGLDVFVNLERPGFRVKRRKLRKNKVGKNHRITKEEAIAFVGNEFEVDIE